MSQSSSFPFKSIHNSNVDSHACPKDSEGTVFFALQDQRSGVLWDHSLGLFRFRKAEVSFESPRMPWQIFSIAQHLFSSFRLRQGPFWPLLQLSHGSLTVTVHGASLPPFQAESLDAPKLSQTCLLLFFQSTSSQWKI